MDGMGGDATLQANDRGDPSAGPDVAPKAVSFGPMVQECWPMEPLAGGQPARSTGAGAAPEGIRTPLARPRDPLADGPFAGAQGFRNLALGPALRPEVPGLKSSGFLPIFG